MKICMVGYGRIAGVLSRHLASIPGVELDTVVGVRVQATEAFAREHGYAHVSYDLEQTLQRPDLDAVVLCSPSPLHAPQSERALCAGKHVLCEIPLALSLADAERLGELAERLDRRLMICHTERFEAGKRALCSQIAAGDLHPLHVIACFHFIRRGNVHATPERASWTDNLLWHHGCHTVDAVLTMLGEPETHDLRAQFGAPWPGLGVPIDVDLQWRSPDGVLVNISLSHNAHWGIHDYRLICLEDTIVCDHGKLLNQEGVVLDNAAAPSPNLLQDREFVEAVRQDRAPEVNVASVLPAMRVLQAAWDTLG